MTFLPSSSLVPPAGINLVIPLTTDGVTSLHISGWILGSKVGWSCVCRFLWCFCYYDCFYFVFFISFNLLLLPTPVHLYPESLEGWVGRHRGALPGDTHDCFSVLTLSQCPWGWCIFAVAPRTSLEESVLPSTQAKKSRATLISCLVMRTVG